jgi:hypothetical protein
MVTFGLVAFDYTITEIENFAREHCGVAGARLVDGKIEINRNSQDAEAPGWSALSLREVAELWNALSARSSGG